MIFTFLLGFSAYLIEGFKNLLAPAASLPSFVSEAFSFVIVTLNQFSFILPIDHMLAALAAVVGFEFIFWGFQGGVWVYRHIPFLGH